MRSTGGNTAVWQYSRQVTPVQLRKLLRVLALLNVVQLSKQAGSKLIHKRHQWLGELQQERRAKGGQGRWGQGTEGAGRQVGEQPAREGGRGRGCR